MRNNIGPSSRIHGEDRQKEVNNAQPRVSKITGISASSHAIKRSPAKTKIASAVVIAAKNARNPVQDYRNNQREKAKQTEAIQKAAEQFAPKNTRVKPVPPPRNPERAIIELTCKSVNAISPEEQSQDQQTLNELYKQLEGIVNKYGPQPPPIDPKQREKLMSRVVIVPTANTQEAGPSQSQPNEIAHDATQCISSSSSSSSDSTSSSDSESDKDVLKVTEPISLPANEQPANPESSSKLDPEVSRELDAVLDYSNLKVPRNWLPTESEEEAAQKQSAVTEWVNDLSDSSPDQSPVVNRQYDHQQSTTQVPSRNQFHTSITERQIAISTSGPNQDTADATERTGRNAQIEKLTRELIAIKAKCNHLQHLQQVATSLQQPSAIPPSINIRIDNTERRRYKRDFTDHERQEYFREINSRPMSRGATRRLKQRIYKRRQ